MLGYALLDWVEICVLMSDSIPPLESKLLLFVFDILSGNRASCPCLSTQTSYLSYMPWYDCCVLNVECVKTNMAVYAKIFFSVGCLFALEVENVCFVLHSKVEYVITGLLFV
jgi:hypothetical protein